MTLSTKELEYVEQTVKVEVELEVRVAAEFASEAQLAAVVESARGQGVAEAVERCLRLNDAVDDGIGWAHENSEATLDGLLSATVIHVSASNQTEGTDA